MDKELWRFEEIKTPPIGTDARREIGYLLRMLQAGFTLAMPQSRPMPTIGRGCHELRVNDENQTWRTIYCIGKAHIVVLYVFSKKSNKTPRNVITTCKKRLTAYRAAMGGRHRRD